MATQTPSYGVNVRLTQAQVDLLDAWAFYLTRKRGTLTNRSDVVRTAIAKLPVPNDSPEIARAMEAL